MQDLSVLEHGSNIIPELLNLEVMAVLEMIGAKPALVAVKMHVRTVWIHGAAAFETGEASTATPLLGNKHVASKEILLGTILLEVTVG